MTEHRDNERPASSRGCRPLSTNVNDAQSLSQNPDLFRIIIECQNDLVVLVDPAGRFLYVSPSYCELFGRTEAELLGQEFMPLVHESDRDRTAAAFKRALGPAHGCYVEQRALTREGWRWLAWSDKAVLTVKGEVIAVVGVGRDITIARESQSELKRSQAVLRALFDHTEALLWSIREDTDGELWYEQVNAAFATIEGHSSEHYTGKRLADLHGPAELKAMRYSVDRAKRGEPHIYEVRFEREDRCRWFDIRFIPIPSPDGRIRHYVGTGGDITARKKSEDVLRAEQQRLHAAIESLPVMISAYDEDGRVIVRNREYTRVTGYDTDELTNVAEAYEALYPDPETRERIAERLKTDSGNYRDWELEVTGKGGTKKWVAWSDLSRTVSIPGWPKWGIGIEITERKRAEAEVALHRHRLEELVRERTSELLNAREELVRKDKLATLGQVAGGVAHELSNPLAVLKNAVFYLKMGLGRTPDEKVTRHLAIIDEYVDRANRTVSTIMDFARSRPPRAEKQQVRWLIDRAMDEADLSGQFSTDLSIPDDLPAVTVDDQQMLVVFRNLILNAAQAMPEGGTISIEADERGRFVEVDVIDQGMGIETDALDRLFEPLFTTREYGAGLGLTISKRFVEANGGTISVRSKPGRGTTFTVTMPIA